MNPTIAPPELVQDQTVPGYAVRVFRADGTTKFEVEIDPKDDGLWRVFPFNENGIVVKHPTKPWVYINGSTGQASKDPEVLRTRLILDAKAERLGAK